VSLTFAAPEVSKRRRESFWHAGGGSHQGDDHMNGLFNSEDLVKGAAFLASVLGAVLIIGGALANS
jgi:hypothetical protein